MAGLVISDMLKPLVSDRTNKRAREHNEKIQVVKDALTEWGKEKKNEINILKQEIKKLQILRMKERNQFKKATQIANKNAIHRNKRSTISELNEQLRMTRFFLKNEKKRTVSLKKELIKKSSYEVLESKVLRLEEENRILKMHFNIEIKNTMSMVEASFDPKKCKEKKTNYLKGNKEELMEYISKLNGNKIY